MSKKEVRNTLFVQGTILAAAGIITKIIGFVYRIPMANILGNQGNGIYSVSFGIYNIALTLSSYSLPLAVSKLVSARLARREYRNSYRIMTRALIFALIVGSVACAVIYFGADTLEELYNRQGLAKPLRILAPTTLVVAILGVFRGFFQGNGNMIPTAISQIIEQIINAVVSIIAAWQFTRAYADSELVHAYGAAGGTLGTLTGAAAALLFFLFVLTVNMPVLKKKNRVDRHNVQSDTLIYRAIILTVIPVILSQTIYQIGYTIDDFLFGNIMADRGVSDQVVSSIQGVFNTQYNQLINLPVAVATSMAASTIPSIVQSHIVGNASEVNYKTDIIVKFNMAIAVPSAVGLAVLGRPIIELLFPRLSEYHELAASLLLTGSSAVVFYALSTITTAILQGSSMMRIPVIHSAVSLVIHVILVYVLLKYTELGVYGLLIGNVTFPIIVSLLNCHSISKIMRYRWKVRKTFFLPVFASVIMGAAAVLCYNLLYFLIHINALALIVSIAAAVIVYGMVLLRLGCFTKDELLDLPMGGRIARFARL